MTRYHFSALVDAARADQVLRMVLGEAASFSVCVLPAEPDSNAHRSRREPACLDRQVYSPPGYGSHAFPDTSESG